MKTSRPAFSLLETTLFIGLSGLLLIALTANHTRSIAIQRYEDSVDSLANFVKDVYASFLNPENQNEDGINRAGCSIADTDTIDSKKGASECSIYGKLIVIGSEPIAGDEKGTIYAFDVVGKVVDHDNPYMSIKKSEDGNNKAIEGYKGESNDSVLKQLYTVKADYRAKEGTGSDSKCIPAGSMTKYVPEWDAKLQYNESDYKAFILISRSPKDGEITTYVRDNLEETGDTFIITDTTTTIGINGCNSDSKDYGLFFDNSNPSDPKDLYAPRDTSFCLKSEDFFTSGYSQAIIIQENGQDPSAVKTYKEDNAKENYCTPPGGGTP